VPFKDILRELVESTPGATGAILTDWEGEAVECHALSGDEFDLKILGAHQNIILNRLREIRHDKTAQVLSEAVITTDLQRIVIGAVGKDYSLVMTLERRALLGRAIYRMQRSARLLEKEIY
jgi:predicted regulator of Ras-like GTPase activity (Roadblock/LC7/MglB family)